MDATAQTPRVTPEFTLEPEVAPSQLSAGTCLIFDWDDTLLCSSWLNHNNLRLDSPMLLPPEAVKELETLQDSVIPLLERASKHGQVIIITNAELGWVEQSCRKFMPRVLPHVTKLKVLSARSTFERSYPDSPSDWKEQAFGQEIQSLYHGKHVDHKKNVLSFGDSIHERTAIQKVTANMGPSTHTKSIKFVERPTAEQLKRQVDFVLSCFEEIVGYEGSLDLMLTISVLYPNNTSNNNAIAAQ